MRLQYSQGTPLTKSVRDALSDALKDLELPNQQSKKNYVRDLSKQRSIWSAPLLADVAGAARMLKSTKLSSLYAGLFPALVAVVPTAIVYMPTYEMASATLIPMVPERLVAPLAGLATGVACATVRVPASVLKSRVQLGLAPNAFVAFRRVVKKVGLGGLYAGFWATLVLDVATAVVQFTALDIGRRTPGLSSSNAALGFFASALATAVTEPIDVVRTRIMSQIKGQKDLRFNYTSLVDGLRTAAKTEGFAALYRGLLPRLVLKSLGGAIWYTRQLLFRFLSHSRAQVFDVHLQPRFASFVEQKVRLKGAALMCFAVVQSIAPLNRHAQFFDARADA